MVETKARKPVRWQSVVGQSLFVVMMLLIAGFLWRRQQLERLSPTIMTADSIGGVALTDDTRYLITTGAVGMRAAETTVQAQSLRSGEIRTLCKEAPPYIAESSRTAAGVWEGSLYYAIRVNHIPDLKPGTSGLPGSPSGAKFAVSAVSTGKNGAPVVSGNEGPGIGTFLLQPQSPATTIPGQTRVISSTKENPAPQVLFRQVALQGGTPRTVATLQGDTFCLAANSVFWIKPAQEETARVTQGENPQTRLRWTETSAHSDLMLTSLADGATRCIRHGIPRHILLTRCQAGMSWKEPSPYPAPPRLLYARVADGSVVALGTITNDQNPPLCVEVGKRLYWVDAPHEYTLMSANLDGSSLRVVEGIKERHQIGTLLLYGYKGSLYGCLQEMNPGGAEAYPLSLCKLHPDRQDPVEILRKISGKGVATDAISNMQFGGGYLYFQLLDQPGLWSSDVGVRQTLCRIPLER